MSSERDIRGTRRCSLRGRGGRGGRAASGLVASAVAVVLAGCGSGVGPTAAQGPLESLGTPVSYCVSTRPGTGTTIGSDLLRNSGSQVAVVKRVALLDPSGLRLVGVLAVPVVSPALVGNGWPYPLPPAQAKYLAHGVEWAKRAAAAGSRIPPSAPKDLVNLVVGLRVTGPSPGTAGGLEVDYTAGGRSYVIDTATSVVVQLAPHHC